MRKSSQVRKLFELARGGMGRIDLVSVRDGTFLRLQAVKRLHHLGGDDTEFREMFLDEARIAGLIRHANVVSVLDVDEDDDGPFLVMDYIEGVSLKNVIVHHHDKKELPPIQLCARIGAQIAQGLHAAHELKTPDGKSLELVHRDVSPQNVIVGFDGVVRVTDFGVAKAHGRSTQTNAGVLKGKLGYFSPEQLRFEEPDRRSDLFALGVILYEMLTAERLYANKDGTEGVQRTLSEPPPDLGEARPEAPTALVELLFELLGKDPDDRPSTAREVARRLDAVVAGLSASEGPLEVSEYLETTFGEARNELSQRVARRLEELGEKSDAEESVGAGVATRPPSAIPPDSTEAGPGAMTKGTKSNTAKERRGVWMVPVVFVVAIGVGVVMSQSSRLGFTSDSRVEAEAPSQAPVRSTPVTAPTTTPSSSPIASASTSAAPAGSRSATRVSGAAPLFERGVVEKKPKSKEELPSKSSRPPASPFEGLGARE